MLVMVRDLGILHLLYHGRLYGPRSHYAHVN
jgi:hypothetical protein